MLPMVSTGAGAGQFMAELVDEVNTAERHGFDLALVPEHHGGPGAALSDPMSTVAWLLAKTKEIKVGTGVLVLPLHSIPRLAEQAALLQHASGGRLVIGVGAGYQPSDFEPFGIRLDTRGRLMSEGIAGLKQAWSTGFWNGHPIRPQLGEDLSPPLFVGSWAPAGIRRAARESDGWIADPIRSLDETALAAKTYLSMARDGDRPHHIAVMREAWVADTDQEAAAVFGPVIEPIFRYYLRNGAFPAGHGLTADELTIDRALADRVICGAPATVTDKVSSLVAMTHADTVVFGLRHPRGPAHAEVLLAIERLGREVLPAVRSRLTAEWGIPT
jgi:alkanesulfonate monooxygenase SsuD/methylene tetrahydromethanopterin reductase-like flavin-dependent oxidoreductase (luciferase family)